MSHLQIDTDKDGSITLEEWIQYSIKHIGQKERSLPPDPLTSDANCTKEDFIRWAYQEKKEQEQGWRDLTMVGWG